MASTNKKSAITLLKRKYKELKCGVNSTMFKFIYDEPGQYLNNPGVAYILFNMTEGTYADQSHIISIKFEYGDNFKRYQFPSDPPLVRFETPIYHANICDGAICLDII